MSTTLFIINPSSGGLTERFFRKNIRTLAEDAGFNAPDFLFLTPDTFRCVKETLCRYDTVVVGGGDGTLSSVAGLAASLKHKPRLALLPMGIGNDLCRSLGLLALFQRKGVAGIAELIKTGKTVSLDVIRSDTGRYFTNYFSFGSDARVAHAFDRIRKTMPLRLLGFTSIHKLCFFLLGLKNIFFRKNRDIILKVRAGNGSVREMVVPKKAYGLILSNITSYGGGALLSSFSNVSDGKFEIVIISTFSQLAALHATRFVRRPLDRIISSATCFQTTHAWLEFSGRIPCQADGEALTGFSQGKNRFGFSAGGSVDIFVP